MGPSPSTPLAILCASEHRVDAALALAAGVPHSSLFLMHSGVRALAHPRLAALLDDGVDVTVCAMDAEAHGFHPRTGGARFGSQYDHAVLVREASRFCALTPRAVVESAPAPGPRRVRVRIGCDPRLPEVHQGLRAALACAALDLDVTVAIDPESEALLVGADHPPPVMRALATLRALGRAPVRTADSERGTIEVCW